MHSVGPKTKTYLDLHGAKLTKENTLPESSSEDRQKNQEVRKYLRVRCNITTVESMKSLTMTVPLLFARWMVRA